MSKENSHSEPTPRIETMSDMIFGLALSIAAFALIDTPPTSNGEILGDIILFAFNFLVIISVWIRYTAIMSVLPVETRSTMFLNIVLLFLVGVEPYAFNLVSLIGSFSSTGLDNYASIIYALDMGGLMLILGLFSHALSLEERGLVSHAASKRYRTVRNVLFLSAGLFFATILPPFWDWTVDGAPIRFYFWLIPLLVSYVKRAYKLPGERRQVYRSKGDAGQRQER